MLLKSTKDLHYPITVKELSAQEGDTVERFAPLFYYAYKSTVTQGRDEVEVEKSFTTVFESEAEGKITSWRIRAGTVIERAG